MCGRMEVLIAVMCLAQTVVVSGVGRHGEKIAVAEIVQRVSERVQVQLGSPLEMVEQSGSCSRHACSSREDEDLLCSVELGNNTKMCTSCGDGFRVRLWRLCAGSMGNLVCAGHGVGFAQLILFELKVNRRRSYVRTPPGIDPGRLPLGVKESLCLHQVRDACMVGGGLVMIVWP